MNQKPTRFRYECGDCGARLAYKDNRRGYVHLLVASCVPGQIVTTNVIAVAVLSKGQAA